MKKKIAIFASGGGSDMQSVVDACERGEIEGEVVALVTNKDGIGAIGRADRHGIRHAVFALKDYGDAEARDRAIADYLEGYRIDLIVLAGYLAIVTPVLVDRYEGRMINIHPSLIPRHCGVGMYGLNVHKSVIASGDVESGCTVHFVDRGADTGKIIEQRRVPVIDGDTPETLQARVLKEEHRLLPQVVARLCADK